MRFCQPIRPVSSGNSAVSYRAIPRTGMPFWKGGVVGRGCDTSGRVPVDPPTTLWESHPPRGREKLCHVADHYADGTYRWWHLSEPSPELLQSLADGWLPLHGHTLDVGCGLGSEAAHLHRVGWRVVGVDLSPVAAATAAERHHGPSFLQADLLCLPFRSSSFDAALDRGCFHYLAPEDRLRYSSELGRVLRPGGKLLLRASLGAAGVRNDIDEEVILATFSGWRIDHMHRANIPTDTRTLDVILVRLTM